MEFTMGNISQEVQLNISNIAFEPMGQHRYTYAEVLDQFSQQFLFKTGLMAASFLIVMAYLQYYTISMQKEHKRREREAGYKLNMKRKDHILIFISDVFFLASVAYALIYASYYLGWGI